MRTINNSNFVRNHASRFSTSSSFITIVTLIVCAFVMQSGWIIKIKAACVTGGSGWCQMKNGANPCSLYSSCTQTGPGYQCYSYNGNGYTLQTETNFMEVPTLNWPRCTTVSSTSYSCTESYQMCGTTQHFYNNGCLYGCSFASWYGTGCKGSGTICK